MAWDTGASSETKSPTCLRYLVGWITIQFKRLCNADPSASALPAGTLDSAVTLGRHGAKNFLMRDGRGVVQCIFYENVSQEKKFSLEKREHFHHSVFSDHHKLDLLVCLQVYIHTLHFITGILCLKWGWGGLYIPKKFRQKALFLVQQEKELPRLIRGQVHRCVGNYDRSGDVLMCVSVRPSQPSELRNAQQAVRACDAEMRRLVKSLSEVWPETLRFTESLPSWRSFMEAWNLVVISALVVRGCMLWWNICLWRHK